MILRYTIEAERLWHNYMTRSECYFMEHEKCENRKRTDVLGVGFDNVTMDEAVANAVGRIDSRGALMRHAEPRDRLGCAERADLSKRLTARRWFCRTLRVVYAARIFGRPLIGKVAGIDFASVLMKNWPHTRKAFICSRETGVAESAAETLKRRYRDSSLRCGEVFKDDGPVIDDINRRSRFSAGLSRRAEAGLLDGVNVGKLDVDSWRAGGSLTFRGTDRRPRRPGSSCFECC